MKNFVFAAMALVVFAFNGNAQERLTSKDLETVGIQHNDGLKNLYYFIKDEKIEQKNANKIVEFLITEIENETCSEEEKDLSKELIIKAFRNKNFSLNTIYFNDIKSKIDENTLKYLDHLNTIIDENLEDPILLNKSILEFENQIYKDHNLSNKELFVLFVATNVAKYSYAYWTENIQAWKELNSNNSLQRGEGVRAGKRILGMDIASGVGAAVHTWYMNAVPGAGQAAYGTAVAAGALGGSACQAVYELLGWGFNF